MSKIALRFLAAASIVIALTACGKKDETDAPGTTQQSGNTPITATASWKYTEDYSDVMSACAKISTLTNTLAETAARTFNNPINGIRFIKSHIADQRCYITVTTSNGPKDCLVPAVIKFGNGTYSAAAPETYRRCP